MAALLISATLGIHQAPPRIHSYIRIVRCNFDKWVITIYREVSPAHNKQLGVLVST